MTVLTYFFYEKADNRLHVDFRKLKAFYILVQIYSILLQNKQILGYFILI